MLGEELFIDRKTKPMLQQLPVATLDHQGPADAVDSRVERMIGP